MYTVRIKKKGKDSFLQNGFLKVDNILDNDEIQMLSHIFDLAFDSEYEAPGLTRHNLGGTINGRKILPQVLNPSEAFQELLNADFKQRLLSIACSVLGEDMEYSHDHMILKPAHYGAATPWHQDQAYHNPAFLYRSVNIWIPLEDATVESGCLQFISGSHRGVIMPHQVVKTPGGHALCVLGQDYWSVNGVPLPCPVGSATLHHSYMLHYAGPNKTDKSRRAYIVVFKAPPIPLAHPLVFNWQNKEELPYEKK